MNNQDYAKEEFFDRFLEIKQLKKKFDTLTRGELCILYGRRRLGKTRLILKFLEYVNNKKCKSVYLYVPESSSKGVMDQFSYAIKESLNETIKIKDWNVFFEYLNELSKKEKVVVIIDEFQRFQDSSKEFISLLQHYWDNKLKKNKIMLISLGSSIGMMNDIFLNSRGALYGRVTSRINLKPFRFIDFREMFKDYSLTDQIKIFSVFGGTPYYLDLVKKLKSTDILEIILKLCLIDSGPLVDEPLRALSSELKNPGRYNDLLKLISAGKKEFHELEQSLTIRGERGTISPYLSTLQNLLSLISKENPLLIKSKSTRYEITDNFFRFWYKFIFPNKRILELKNHGAVLSKIDHNINAYYGRIFEKIVRELLILFNNSKLKTTKIVFEDIGSWWEKQNEIDIILRNKNTVFLGDVKWKEDKKVTLEYVKKFLDHKDDIDFNGTIKFMFFSRAGFEKEAKTFLEENKILHMDLKEIQEAFDSKRIHEKIDQRKVFDFG